MTPNERIAVHLRVKRFLNLIEALAQHGESSGGAVLIQPSALKLLCTVVGAASSFMGSEAKWVELEMLDRIEKGLCAIAGSQMATEMAAAAAAQE
jgi:hypothetical protein